ncbi:MAG TPA: tetratricopeptide repeat protein [Candidatus Angelobacter sp.]|jgi:Flp pilus assembly protein TadD|nr:tetratricopeptide repeat protein [Candidatus Angelobacter sp.]
MFQSAMQLQGVLSRHILPPLPSDFLRTVHPLNKAGIYTAQILVAALCLLSSPSSAQNFPGSGADAEISGVVHLEGRPAPEGIQVLLDTAPSRDQAVAGSGEIDRTLTNSSGKFIFPRITSMDRGNTKLFAVTVRLRGYQDAVQIVDLSVSLHGYASLDLHRTEPANRGPKPGGVFISAHQPSSPEAQEALAKGEDLLLVKHDPKASIEHFKKLTKLDPKYTTGFLLLGTAHMQLQEWPDAHSAFEHASKLEPKNPEAWLGVGAALDSEKDFSGAQKALAKSLELQPNSPEANYEMARSYWGTGDWQRAEPYARKALELNRTFAPPHVVMGNIYLRHRNADAALGEFQEYLRLDPQGQFAPGVKEMIAKIHQAGK